MKKALYIWSIILLCLICSGCGFKLRSASAFPTELKQLYFSSTNPDSFLSIQLHNMFNAMHVQLVKQKTQARFSILITNDNFIYGRPEIVNVALPMSLNFSQSATVDIQDNKNGNIITSQTFVTSQVVTLNANQMYTTGANTLIQQELNRQAASLIYYWLISTNTQLTLQHANSAHTIKQSS